MRGKEKGQLEGQGGGDAAGIVLVSAATAPAASRLFAAHAHTQDMEGGAANLSP
jgi:hypothetical protein